MNLDLVKFGFIVSISINLTLLLMFIVDHNPVAWAMSGESSYSRNINIQTCAVMLRENLLQHESQRSVCADVFIKSK